MWRVPQARFPVLEERMSSKRHDAGFGGLLIRLVINAVALYAAAQIVPGVHFTRPDDWQTVILVALIFGVINALIRPLALLVTCLINVVTLGLFTLVVNAGMLWVTSEAAARLCLGFRVEDFWAALLGALVISVISLILSKLLD
jgi:putative membrane protein